MRWLVGSSLLLIGLNTGTVSAVLSDVCYGYLGCFSMADPWFSAVRPIPAPQWPEVIDTQFYLYTRTQPRHMLTKLPSISLAGSSYDGSKTTFFLVQGFISNTDQLWILAMKDALLQELDANVILVDWRKGSSQLNYLQVASNARVVAAEVVRLARFLVTDKGADVSRYHLIGHSIGAHIAGYVGKAIPGIARITALDAGQPGFEGYPGVVRLTKYDAVFVQAIHTNGRPFFPNIGFGYIQPIGHVDFYVNGGADQPGCTLPPTPNVTAIHSLDDLNRVTIDFLVSYVFCQHERAFYVFTESVANKGCTFWGHKADLWGMSLSIFSKGYLSQFLDLGECRSDTCSPMGLQASVYPARGRFLVKTKGSKPYCMFDQHNEDVMAKYKTAPTALV